MGRRARHGGAVRYRSRRAGHADVAVQMVIGGADTEIWEITYRAWPRLWMPGAAHAGRTRLDRHGVAARQLRGSRHRRPSRRRVGRRPRGLQAARPGDKAFFSDVLDEGDGVIGQWVARNHVMRPRCSTYHSPTPQHPITQGSLVAGSAGQRRLAHILLGDRRVSLET